MEQQKTLDYTIDDIGGVEHVKLQLKPGVSVLRGRNAIGKTSAIQAVARAQGGKVPIERRDGTDRGTIEGPGVKLIVRQVVKASGQAEMALADTGPLARLIDPGLKNTDAAARERIRALIELIALSIDDEILRTLTSKDEKLYEWLKEEVRLQVIDDVMDASETFRHHAHALAREQEETASQAEGQEIAAAERGIDILAALGGEKNLVDESIINAQSSFDGAIREHERAVAKCEAREELEAKQVRIRGTIGGRPDIDAISDRVQDLSDQLIQARSTIQRLEQEFREAKAAEGAKLLEHNAAQDQLEITKEVARRHDEQQAILAEPLDGPTRDEVEVLKVKLVEGARVKLGKAVKSAEYQQEEQAKNQAERTKDEARKRADYLRNLAAGIPQRLGEILAEAGAPGLTVAGGRLQAVIDDPAVMPKDYELRCSTGEKVSLALDVAATAYQGKVLPLDGHFWLSLDPKNRAKFAQLAEERGLYVITEEAANGDLRLEQAQALKAI